jgi:iron complex outermembrane receptor protein
MNNKLMVTSCASMLSLCFPAYGQQAGAPDQPAKVGAEPPVETVFVTANKRQPQILVEAPMSIQAFTGKDLAAKNVTRIDDLITAVPGASQSEQLGEFIRTYAIRGSGSGGGAGDAMLGYYVDDTAYVTPNMQFAPPLRLLDIQQVEVLRGPYGTLYGQGAMGGTMIFRTKNPNLRTVTGDAETYVANVKGSDGPSYGAAAALSIPLIEGKLGVRISGGSDFRAGYADVYAGDPTGAPRATDANRMRKGDARAVLLWVPDDKLRVRLQYMHFGGNQDYSQQMASLEPAYFANYGQVEGYEKSANDLYGLTVDYDLGFANLTSATGYTKFDTSYLSGLRAPFLGNGKLFNGYKGDSVTQELRLASTGDGPLRWVGGLYYNDAKSTFSYDVDFEVPVINTIGATTISTRNTSVFGEVSYDLFGGKLVPLLGLRHYRDQRSFDGATSTPAPTSSSGKASPDVVTWRANLAYHPGVDATLYLNVGTGFRSGIVQAPLQVAALQADGITASEALSPDRMKNIEIGAKGVLRAAKLTYEVNAYRLQYTGIQSALTTAVGLTAHASLGDATVRGIDFGVQWTPLKGLNLGLSGDRNWSKYGDVNPLVARGIGDVVKDGARLLNTPKYTARLDAGYSKPLAGAWTLYTNGSVSRSASRLNQNGIETAEFNLVDANLGLRSATYEAEIYGQNLGDARGPWYIRMPGFIAGPNPRTVGLRARYHF